METSDKKGMESATQDLCNVVADNLKKLISKNNITQKELADRVGVTAASMTDYCKARRLPTVEFLVALKQLFGISIDEFLTQSLIVKQAHSQETDRELTSNTLTTYQKYCGSYFVYYFDTSKLKGRDMLLPKDSLLYGVLCIYETPSYIGLPHYSCAAILGIHERENASSLKVKLEELRQPTKIIEYIGTEYTNTAYFGDFELSQEHAFVSMSHANTDKALLIFHRVDNNKDNYTGGIGTINSISKGRERMPVIQFMGISRYPLSLTVEEIHHRLLLNYPTFKAEAETEEMIQTFKTLYVSEGEPKHQFTDYQKSIMVQSTLERYIRKSLERNMFRYGKISERDDDDWYHSIKDASMDENAD